MFWSLPSIFFLLPWLKYARWLIPTIHLVYIPLYGPEFRGSSAMFFFFFLPWAPRSFPGPAFNNICSSIHTRRSVEVSQSVNLSLGLRWTGSRATPSQHKTSSTRAVGLMLGMIMTAFSLILPHLLCPVLCLSVSPPPSVSSSHHGRWLREISWLRVDLFHVIPQSETNTNGHANSCSSTPFFSGGDLKYPIRLIQSPS